MRIAIVTENFLPKVDGVTRTLTRLLEHLNNTHHQVIVFGPESGMSTYANATLYGTTGIPFLPYPELKLNIWRPSFTKVLLDFKPDLIHLVEPIYFCTALITLLNWKEIKIPIVSSYHTNLATYCTLFGWGWFENVMWSWNKYCHRQSQFTVCPSPSTSKILQSKGFKNLRVWPRGIDLQLFSPKKRSLRQRTQWTPNDKTIILYVGRVSFEKNLDLLIQSYKHMDHRKCHLVIVGLGPALDRIKLDCKSTNTPISLLGYLQGEELATVYASADIFAFPSFTETFGQVVLESMASGLPVVGLLAEGVQDLVIHEKTGLLLNTENLPRNDQVEKYRHLLTLLVYDNEKRSQLRMNSLEKCKEYTWFGAMEQLVQVYKEAISTHNNNHTQLIDQPPTIINNA